MSPLPGGRAARAVSHDTPVPNCAGPPPPQTAVAVLSRPSGRVSLMREGRAHTPQVPARAPARWRAPGAALRAAETRASGLDQGAHYARVSNCNCELRKRTDGAVCWRRCAPRGP